VSHKRPVTIPDDASLIEAAKLLRTGTDLVAVRLDKLFGWRQTDVVNQFSQCQGASYHRRVIGDDS
jgi:hypothetical protein